MKMRQDIPLHWFVHQDGAWRRHDCAVHSPAPEPIVARLAPRHRDPQAVYIYSFRSIRLEIRPFDEASREQYLRLATEAEKQFAAGTLFSPGQ